MLDLQCKRPRYFTWPPELVEAELELDELEDEPELPELCDDEADPPELPPDEDPPPECDEELPPDPPDE